MKVLYSDDFKNSAKKLSKRYKSLKKDLKLFTDSLENDFRQGTELLPNVYKVRIKNSDNNKGKSSGYRIITYLITEYDILLVNIYSKNDMLNISDKEISIIIEEYKKEN